MSPTDLRVPLSALPGFDPVGLRCSTASSGDGHWLCVADGWLTDANPRVSRNETTRVYDGPMSGVVLDLSDSATRDRVARWVAARVGLEVGCTAPGWGWVDNDPTNAMRDVLARGWVLGSAFFVWGGCGTSDLDPTDDTCLPDGSRVVDAVALARVAVYLGAQP